MHLSHCLHVRAQISVREHHALWGSSSAGSVKQRCHVVLGCFLDFRFTGFLKVDGIQIYLPDIAIGCGILNSQFRFIGKDYYLRFGMFEDVLDLAGGKADVHGHRHGSPHERAEVEGTPLGPVLREYGYPSASLKTLPFQNISGRVGHPNEFFVRNESPLAVLQKVECLLFGMGTRGTDDHLVEGHGFLPRCIKAFL